MFYKFSSTSLRSNGCVDAVWENKGRSAHVTLKGSPLPLHLSTFDSTSFTSNIIITSTIVHCTPTSLPTASSIRTKSPPQMLLPNEDNVILFGGIGTKRNLVSNFHPAQHVGKNILLKYYFTESPVFRVHKNPGFLTKHGILCYFPIPQSRLLWKGSQTSLFLGSAQRASA